MKKIALALAVLGLVATASATVQAKPVSCVTSGNYTYCY